MSETEENFPSDPDMQLRLHFEAEADALNHLFTMEKEYRAHNTLMLKEFAFQKELIERLWLLSQRYIILVSTGPCCKYPDIYSGPAEDVILTEYHDKLKQVHASNCRVMSSCHELRRCFLTFQQICTRLDMSVESPLMLGDTFHKPFAYFMELVCDLFKCFHATILKAKCFAHQLDPEELVSLEEYKKFLLPSEEFQEYLTVGLTYCKCLQPRKGCGEKPTPLDLRTCKESNTRLINKEKS